MSNKDKKPVTQSGLMKRLAEQVRENKEIGLEGSSVDDKKEKEPKEEKVLKDTNKIPDDNRFEEYLKRTKEFRVGAANSYVYIDSEIKEIISMLCSKYKVDAKNLVSMILKSWIDEYKTDISRALTGNKYL